MDERDQGIDERGGFAWQSATPVVLFAVVTALYLPSARYDFIYDDHTLILNEPVPGSLVDVSKVFVERHFEGLPYYRPVPRFTMVLQKYLHGDNPAAYHVFNAVAAACLAVLALALFRAPGFAIPPLMAFLGAGLVALHPVASATVYPICSGRETLMPAVFAIAATRCFLGAGKASYVAAMALLVVGLLSMEQAVVVPLLFLLADICGVSACGRPRDLMAWGKRNAPVAVILLVYLFVRWQLFEMGEHRFELLKRPFGPLLSFVFAAQTICVPFVQLVYEPSVEAWTSVWRGAVCVGTAILLAAGAYHYWPKIRARFLFWLGWSAFAFLPTANILDQEAPFAERYVLLSLVGVIGIVGTVASAVWDRLAVRRTIGVVAFVLLVACAAISFQRGRFYRDEMAFYRQWVKSNPMSSQAHVCLGHAYFRQDQWDKAVAEYNEALRIDPNDRLALTHLGVALGKRGRHEEAFGLLRRVLRLDPDHIEAHISLGRLLMDSGDLSEAVVHLRSAASLRPRSASIHYQLGRAFNGLGRLDEAQVQFEQTLQLRPDDPDALNDLGIVLATKGAPNDLIRAANCFRRAIEIDSGFADAHYNLGVFDLTQGNLKDAAAHIATALRLDPEHPMAARTLKRIQAAARRKP